MPVFINEVVFRGEIDRGEGGRRNTHAASIGQAIDPAKREALIAEVTKAVLDEVERRLAHRDER